jgi:hypothetical protein
MVSVMNEEVNKSVRLVDKQITKKYIIIGLFVLKTYVNTIVWNVWIVLVHTLNPHYFNKQSNKPCVRSHFSKTNAAV